jgi:predicted ABC-type ATPase
MRIFAGPNGSGKTTIINDLKTKIDFGVYVNADDIEQTLSNHRVINFMDFNLHLNTTILQAFFKESKLSPIKHNNHAFWEHISVKDNYLTLHPSLEIDSYFAADIAELIRQQLLKTDLSFTYETVMSHPDKINFLIKAKEQLYRIYLYYIATEDPTININRVNVRVAQNGHSVNPEVIERRYYKSLQNLKPAIRQTNRAYIFDNSGSASLLVAEITNGIDVHVIDPDRAPNWFIKYVFE